MENISYTLIKGDLDTKINKIAYDHRKIKPGDLFVCIEGFSQDGHKYIEAAVENGAVAILCSKKPDVTPDCTILMVEDSRAALARIAAKFYNHPEKTLKIIGITGTNGKTTTTYMIKSVLERVGYKVGLVGTIANYIGNRKLHTERTTPESLELMELFHEMVVEGVEYCVMEVSSHSLYLKRVEGIEFTAGIFTNLTQDHLDFHKTFENYYEAKKILFTTSKLSVINIDDSYGKRLVQEIAAPKLNYGKSMDAEIRAVNINSHSRGIGYELHFRDKVQIIELPLPGEYNVYNSMACAAVCISQGIALTDIAKGLSEVVVPGRCELVSTKYGLDYDIILDYAHSPDALENILKSAREFTKGRLIAVFGCGGDRDATKRPIMGKIGTELSDIAVITSDNPRTEEPNAIIEEIIKGISKDNYIVEPDRKKAIAMAIKMAQSSDVIIIAGKGHEDYQVLKSGKIHFDEREVVDDILKEL